MKKDVRGQSKVGTNYQISTPKKKNLKNQTMKKANKWKLCRLYRGIMLRVTLKVLAYILGMCTLLICPDNLYINCNKTNDKVSF